MGGHCPHPTSWGPRTLVPEQAATHQVGIAVCPAPCRHGGQLTLPNWTPHPGPSCVSCRRSHVLPVGARASIPVPHLHDKLPRICPSHCGALSRRQDPDGPDVQCRCPEIAAQDNTLRRDSPMGIPNHPPPWVLPSAPSLPAGLRQLPAPGVNGGSTMFPQWVQMPTGHSPGSLTPW